MTKRILITALAVISITAAIPARAASTTYELQDRSSFDTGCFNGPCDCAIAPHPMKGSFELVFAGYDGLYDHYDVRDVRWLVRYGDQELDLRGSGKYRVGGEFAIVQQLTLDLSIDGGPSLAFDSGLVPGGGKFPVIDIKNVSLHGMVQCTDTVLQILAAPATAGTGGSPVTFGSRGPFPNPFHRDTRIELVLRDAGPVTASVHDLEGRTVRQLMSGEHLSAGRNVLVWDGRDAKGEVANAGIYFVRVSAAGREYVRAAVKLR
jgi:hypothetical protein